MLPQPGHTLGQVLRGVRRGLSCQIVPIWTFPTVQVVAIQRQLDWPVSQRMLVRERSEFRKVVLDWGQGRRFLKKDRSLAL
jgi:hypothetical protein